MIGVLPCGMFVEIDLVVLLALVIEMSAVTI